MTADHSALYRARVHDASASGMAHVAVLPLEGWPRYLAAVISRRVIAADDVRTDPRTSELVESYWAPLGITSMLDVLKPPRRGPLREVCDSAGRWQRWW